MSLIEAPIRVDRQRLCIGDACYDLRVSRRTLATRGRVIHGCWDPLLQRIELFNANGRSDDELVETLLHELAHARGETEQAAADLGKRWVAEHPDDIKQLADQIRQVVED